MLEEEAVTTKDLNQFSNFTREVRKHGISIEDLSALVKTIDGVRQLGYEQKTILFKLSEFESILMTEKDLMDRVDSFTTRKISLAV